MVLRRETAATVKKHGKEVNSISMTGVIVRPGESFEKALRRFTKTCEKSGILSDVKKNQRYEKPSDMKKRKHNQAIRKHIKEQLEANV